MLYKIRLSRNQIPHLNPFGVMPTMRLKKRTKCCGYWKPSDWATCETLF